MKRRLFFWIYPPYLISILLSAAAFTAFTARSATDFFYELSSMELGETALLSANAIVAAFPRFEPEADRPELQALCDRLTSKGKLRLTVIDMNGRVVADTQAVPESMDIHLDREEIREAISAGYGSAVRKSASTGIPTSYEAVALPDAAGKTIVIVRVALPSSLIGSRRSELISQVFIFGIALVLVVSLLAILLARRLAAPILRIHDGALAFSSGRLDGRIPEEGPLEVANLAKLMNRMAEELGERIRTAGEQKNQVEAILNGMSEAVAVVDGGLSITASNPAFIRLFGPREGNDLLGWTRNTELCEFMQAAIKTKGPLETGLTVYGEHPRQLRLTSSPLEGGKAVLVINDLTRLNRLETVRKDFTANVSHELKTPITSIKASLETLKTEGFSDQALCVKFLDIALRGTDRLESIISDLISLARIEEGEKSGIETERVDLDSVIAVCLEELSPRMEAAGMRAESQGERGLAVRGHEGLLKQAILNLLDNSIRHAASGGAVIISTSIEDDSAVVSIRDRGPGIPERDRARLFERFYRVDRARSRDSGGTGLGLAIVKHIAKAHSGSVRVESVEGQGAAFSILLPLLADE